MPRKRETFVCASFFQLEIDEQQQFFKKKSRHLILSLPLDINHAMQCDVMPKGENLFFQWTFHFNSQLLCPRFLFRAQNQSNLEQGSDLHKNSGNVRWAGPSIYYYSLTHHSLTIHYEAPLPEYSLGAKPRPVHNMQTLSFLFKSNSNTL